MTLLITHWTGKLGNNILQIIRAIHFAIQNKHRLILFPKHFFLTEQKIDNLCQNRNVNILIKNTFFNIQTLNINDPEPYLMKIYFQKFIYPIFKVLKKITFNKNDLFIHIRAGDIFGFNPHSYYVQPPLSYYQNIIKSKKWHKIFVVFQDDSNPVVNELKKNEKITFLSNDLYTDLSILTNSNNLVLGFGTFGLLIYCMNTKLKRIYIPKYSIDELPKGSWGDTKINIIQLPNYIKCGEWRNTPEQRKLMLKYN
jgi:hypothetical protein